MNEKDFKIYWGIRLLKSKFQVLSKGNSGDNLHFYLQGCLDSGIKQERLDKLIDKINEEEFKGW